MNSHVANLAAYRGSAVPEAVAPPRPVAIEAEQAFLGALLINAEVLTQVAGFLRPEHFSEEIHRRIFDVAASLIGQRRAATPATMLPFLGDAEVAEGLSVRAYLARLLAEATTIITAPDYARAIVDMAARRALIAAAGDLTAQAADAPVDMEPSEVASGALGAIQRVLEDHAGRPSRRSFGTIAGALVERARAIQAGEAVDEGISTGLAELDRATGGGFRPGTLWIVGGRPRVGKSILGSGFARKVAERGARELAKGRPGVGAQIWGLELSDDEQTARVLAEMAYTSRRPITYGQILEGRLDPEEIWTVEDARKRLDQIPLALEVAGRPTMAEIAAGVRREKARMAKRSIRLGLIVIDYLKFVRPTDRYRGNPVAEIGEITALAKELAKAEQVCVVMLAQVNRLVDAKDRRDHRPGLQDLRGSGDLESDADVVAFIHRHSLTIKASAEYREQQADALAEYAACEREGEIIVAKTRVGNETTVKIWIDAGCSIFSAIDVGRAREHSF